MADTKSQTQEVKPRVELSIPKIQADLKAGITRDQMKEKYGVKRADIMRIFKHKDLKGLKVHNATGTPKTRRKSEPSFVLRDESGNDVTNVVIEAASKNGKKEGGNTSNSASGEAGDDSFALSQENKKVNADGTVQENKASGSTW